MNSYNQNQKKILIVEDELALLKVLAEKLTHEGFSTLEAKNGKEGLEIAVREHPDCILLDIVMPIMDGLTMLRKLREDPWGKDAPVIVLSNLSDPKTTADAFVHGVHDILVKTDWKLTDVVTKVRERLGES